MHQGVSVTDSIRWLINSYIYYPPSSRNAAAPTRISRQGAAGMTDLPSSGRTELGMTATDRLSAVTETPGVAAAIGS